MAVKRRTIWLDDDTWTCLAEMAAFDGTTISGTIRTMTDLRDLDQDRRVRRALEVRGPILREEVDDLYSGVAPPGREVLEPSFASRSDEIVQRHPAFGHSRPAPKPGRK